jgi:glycerate kinase
LGWSFFDRRGQALSQWTDLRALVRIEAPRRPVLSGEIVVAVDVHNPLLGLHGCTRVYGPQKGLRAGEFRRAEACLRQLAEVVRESTGRDVAAEPGSGAAGGLGFGLLAFGGAILEPGFDLVATAGRLDRRLQQAELVLTGEGALDRSTLMGKGTGELAKRCATSGKPCIALAGAVRERDALQRSFWQVAALTDLAAPDEAMADAPYWLEKLAGATARRFSNG